MKLMKGSILISILIVTMNLLSPLIVMGSPLTEEERQILEKSLSIVEIDREIVRIEAKQTETEESISLLTEELTDKEQDISLSQTRAGARIRAYYMGERENMLGALLSVNNLKDFFTVLDYYQLILDRDRNVLNTYKSEYAELKKAKDKLDKLSNDLSNMKNTLMQQRERVSALQSSLDGSLNASSDPDKLKQLIGELTAYWENVGLYEVRRYFRALASSMSQFPDFLNDHENSLTSDKGKYTLTIREEDLNSFLHSKNELLHNMSFVFEEGVIVAQGNREGMDLRVEGHYTIANEPENSIRFHVDRLLFNGIELPDTTRMELENDFDLGFYPQKIVPFVEATDAKISDGLLIITLKLAL